MAQEEKPTIEAMREGISQREAKLNETTFVFTETVQPQKLTSPLWIAEFEVFRSGEKIRYNRTETKAYEKNGPTTRRIAWDGRRETSLAENSEWPAHRRYSGLITGEKTANFRTLYQWQEFVETGFSHRAQRLSKILETGAWDVLGSKEIRDIPVWGARSPGAMPLLDGYAVEVWVAPQHDFAPVEVILTLNFPDKPAWTVTLFGDKLDRIDDVWVATEANVLADLPTMDFYKDTGPYTFQYHLKSFKRSVPEDDRLFLLQFPVGTSVLDDVAQQSFIAGKTVNVMVPDGSVRMADIRHFPEYQQWTDYNGGVSDEEWAKTDTAKAIETNWVNLGPKNEIKDYAPSPPHTAAATEVAPSAAAASHVNRFAIPAIIIGIIIVSFALLRRKMLPR